MPRLFIAIDLPEDRRDELRHLRTDALPGRWTPEDQFHITLRFLGDTSDADTARLGQRLADIKAPPFRLGADTLGVFPSKRKPRVLVAHVNATPELITLQLQISNLTADLGFKADRKPFSPHLTLARLKQAAPREVRGYLKEHEGFSLDPFLVESFRLYESRLGAQGAVHEVLREYPLRDG